MYDIVIIGAGIIGCGIARELSRLECSIAVLEARDDVAMQTTAANSGIVHAGFDTEPNTLKAELNVRGNRLYDRWSAELEFPFKRTGSLVVAVNEEERDTLKVLLERGKRNGVPKLRIISGDEARQLEPNLQPSVVAALYAGSAGIVSPYNAAFALFENSVANGVEYRFNFAVDSIARTGDGFVVSSGARTVSCRNIINAAGVNADDIAALVGDTSFKISARRGEYMLFDKSDLVSMPIFPTPTKAGKGILTAPTVDGSLYIGPTASDTDDKSVAPTTAEGMATVKTRAQQLVRNIPFGRLITSFAGVRAISGGDFIVSQSKACDSFINVAGICSPGLSAAPAIAERVFAMFDKRFEPRSDFVPFRRAIVPFAGQSRKRQEELIAANPRYGKIICRCETVTEAEIVEAVMRGARTVDGVKRRVRAGMGRCQGGFCLPRVIAIISRELGIPPEQVTKKGGSSHILVD